MITYFRMKQYFNQTRLESYLHWFKFNNVLSECIHFVQTRYSHSGGPPLYCLHSVIDLSVSCCSCAKCLKCVTLLSQTIRNKAPDIKTRYRYLQPLCSWETLLKFWCWSSQGKLFLIKWSMRSKADFHLSDCTIQWQWVVALCLQMQCYGITQ